VDIPIIALTLNANVNARVTRALPITVNRDIIDSGLLNPLTDWVFVRARMNGYPDIPLFAGKPSSMNIADTGQATVRCFDIVDDLCNNDFITPWVTSKTTLASEIAAIVHDALPNVSVNTSIVPVMSPPALTWETDHGQALDDLSKGVNLLWAGDRVGGVVLRTNPYVVSSPISVMSLTDESDGILVDYTQTISREKIYNAVTVVVERADGAIPIRVTAYDNNLASPTLWDGPFGRRNKVVKAPTVMDITSAGILARRLLTQSICLTKTWRLTAPVLLTLDPSDVIRVRYRQQWSTHVVETIDINDKLSTTITTREFRVIDPSLISLLIT
jgi:hypothetical protein